MSGLRVLGIELTDMQAEQVDACMIAYNNAVIASEDQNILDPDRIEQFVVEHCPDDDDVRAVVTKRIGHKVHK